MRHFFPEEPELFARVERWSGPAALAALTPALLREVTACEGIDFATALLHRRIVTSEVHGPFLEHLTHGAVPPLREKVEVAIVPGAFYLENPRTGADGRVVRGVAEQLGLPVSVVPVSSTGTLAGSARILLEWLRARAGRPLLLVSVSKGGSEVKAALADPGAPSAFAGVRGWLNLCGLLDGTPMADWLLSPAWLARANRFVYRIRGRSLDFLDEVRRFPGSALDFPLVLPEGLRAVHVLGFPLRRHLRGGLARRCHERLLAWGPNDGSIILSDTLRWPGRLCPVWGADHYLRPPEDVRPLLAALLGSFLA